MKYYDAREEHKPFERKAVAGNRHPNKNRKEANPYSNKSK